MTLKIAFDFDDAARKHATIAACDGAMSYEKVGADDAMVVIVGEPGKCQGYLNLKKAVVFCPAGQERTEKRALGRGAAIASRRLFVVGSERTPGFFDAVAAAVVSAE